MKNKIFLIFFAFIFASSFFYLHQKILIYVEAYKVSKNYRLCNELIDKRDYLVYNLTKATSVPKINQWAQKNKFTPAEKVLALNLKKQGKARTENKFMVALSNLLGMPAGSSTALARENE
jgi:hypothetical protein